MKKLPDFVKWLIIAAVLLLIADRQRALALERRAVGRERRREVVGTAESDPDVADLDARGAHQRIAIAGRGLIAGRVARRDRRGRRPAIAAGREGRHHEDGARGAGEAHAGRLPAHAATSRAVTFSHSSPAPSGSSGSVGRATATDAPGSSGGTSNSPEASGSPSASADQANTTSAESALCRRLRIVSTSARSRSRA